MDEVVYRTRAEWRTTSAQFSPEELAKIEWVPEPVWAQVDTSEEDELPPEVTATIRRVGPRVGRNQACSCGSGKKRKRCHP